MTDFEKQIKQKTDEELFKILISSQDYQPEFVKLTKREFEETRGKTYEDLIRDKTDEELADYYAHSSDFQAGFIELVKKELTENRHISLDSFQHKKKVQNKNLKKKRDGWLTFFLIVIGIGGVLSPIRIFSTMSLSDYDIGIGHWFSIAGAVSEGILVLGMTFLAFYTIISFNKYKPNAVKLGKSYLIIAFATNLLNLIVGDYEVSEINTVIIPLIWQVIWFIYLSQSNLVEELFPQKERKLFKRDKILLFSIITPIVIWTILVFVLSLSQGVINQSTNQDATNKSELAYNEYTDGRIIFENPDGMVVEKVIQGGRTFHQLTDNDNTSIVIYSEIDDTDTKEYFDEYIQAIAEEAFRDSKYKIKDEQHYFRNGNSVYMKTLLFDSESMIFESESIKQSTFVMLFNKETSTCCILTCGSENDPEFLPDLINSIRFKHDTE